MASVITDFVYHNPASIAASFKSKHSARSRLKAQPVAASPREKARAASNKVDGLGTRDKLIRDSLAKVVEGDDDSAVSNRSICVRSGTTVSFLISLTLLPVYN
jgi:hypothetical protein